MVVQTFSPPKNWDLGKKTYILTGIFGADVMSILMKLFTNASGFTQTLKTTLEELLYKISDKLL